MPTGIHRQSHAPGASETRRQAALRRRTRASVCSGLLALLAGASTRCVLAAAEPPAMQTAAEGFYRTVLETHALGVPDRKARERLAPHLTAALVALLAEADRVEAEYKQVTRGEVPPLEQGDLFSSLFEGATAFEVRSCEKTPTGGSCTVALRYQQPGEAEASAWQDRIALVAAPRQEAGAERWLVDDVAYGGDWEFMHKGTLRGVLAGLIRNGREEIAITKRENLLLGGWLYVKGDTDFEQIAFAVEDGRQVFRSWLHERPDLFADWSRAGDVITIRSDDSSWKLTIVELDERTLELRFDDRKESATFRRVGEAAPPGSTAAPTDRDESE